MTPLAMGPPQGSAGQVDDLAQVPDEDLQFPFGDGVLGGRISLRVEAPRAALQILQDVDQVAGDVHDDSAAGGFGAQ